MKLLNSSLQKKKKKLKNNINCNMCNTALSLASPRRSGDDNKLKLETHRHTDPLSSGRTNENASDRERERNAKIKKNWSEIEKKRTDSVAPHATEEARSHMWLCVCVCGEAVSAKVQR